MPPLTDYALELYRRIGPEGRSQIAAALTEAKRAWQLAEIRRAHPEFTEQEVKLEFLKVVYGFVPRR